MRPARREAAIARSALAILLCLAGAEAAAAPRSLVTKGEGSAKIAFYDSLCDEDNALECMIAEIGCDSPGDFTANLFDLNGRDAASVFAKGNGKGGVAAGGAERSLQVTKVALSEYTYNWNTTLVALEKGGEIWRFIYGSDAVRISAGTKTVTLRRADVKEEAFREAVSICAAEPR